MSFTFDALGRLATRLIPGATETYSYAGSTEAVVRIAAGGTNLDSLVDATGSRLGTKSSAGVNWLLADPHGSVAASLSQDESTIPSAARYDAWGDTLLTGTGGGTAVGEERWRYQGQLDLAAVPGSEPEPEPLYENGARSYAPSLGVFTQLDTFAGVAQDPRSMNRFLYAEGNPASLIDPSGHWAIYEEGAIIKEGEGWHGAASNGTRTAEDVRVALERRLEAEEWALEQSYVDKANGSFAVEPPIGIDELLKGVDITRYNWCHPLANIVSAALSGCTFRPNQFLFYSIVAQGPPGIGDLYQASVINSGCDPIANVCLTEQERQDAAFLAWASGGLMPAIGNTRSGRSATGFAPGTTVDTFGDATNLANPYANLQHATVHLRDDKILPAFRHGESPELYRKLLSPILETPLATFDYSGPQLKDVKGFFGYVGGTPVVIFVHKSGPNATKLASGWQLKPEDFAKYGINP